MARNKHIRLSQVTLARAIVMKNATVHSAETTLSPRLARVGAGEEIVLTQSGQPIAKLAPFPPRPIKRQFRALRGAVSVGPEFFDSLPEAELAGWE